MLGKGLIKGLGITIQHLFEKDITVQYPEQMPFLQERFRGHLYQEFAKCIVCGICVKSCPNKVLSLEEGRNEQSKKKILLTFTIEHQYCMFCNICVENCPANCLHFNHDFELACYRREDTKTVYERAREMAEVIDVEVIDKEKVNDVSEKTSAFKDVEPKEPTQSKKDPAEAMLSALLKNPVKALAKYLPDAEQAELVAVVLQKDEKKAKKVAELMISDKDKARKVIEAMLKSETKAAVKAEEIPAAVQEAPPQEKQSKKDPAEAMLSALLKNPVKALAKYLPDAEQAELVAAVLQKDEKKAKKVAELMISDKDKARKVIEAMLKSETKAAQTVRKASDSGDGGESNEP